MKSCLEHGAPDAEKHVMWYATADRNDMFQLLEKRIMSVIENSDAIVCYNDKLAVNLLRFCREHVVNVPGDISIVGIDDSKYASICDVPLTTVHHPHKKLGEAAANTLLALAEIYPAQQQDILFTPELVVRDSVKDLNKKSRV